MSETTEDPRTTRALDADETRQVEAARQKAFVLYEGRRVPHHSCGIALAETFGLRTEPYQALRRGGITGEGECGAIKAGELILGERLGDPSPTGGVTEELCEAARFYRREWERRVERGSGGADGSIVCDDLTSPFAEFLGPGRQAFCTNIASEVAAVVAETLLRFGARVEITPVPDSDRDV